MQVFFKYLSLGAHGINKWACSSVESTAKTRFTRGKALKACVAKAAGWTLEKAKDVTLPEIKEYKIT